MQVFNKCFVFIQLLVQVSYVVSYTVVLKQVKPFHPPLKLYRYELRQKILPDGNTQYVYHKPPLGQRIYPVLVKPGRDGNYKPRVPVKKEKGKLYKVSSTTEKATARDSRLLGLSQHLVPPVSNQIEEYSEAKEEEESDVRPLMASSHLGKSFSSFGQEKGRIYSNPGEWATPSPQTYSENTTKAEFTPSQLYLQIRHKNTVIHVPQSEALKDAETLEELINAPRLKELSRTTHVQETYSEEGYEDAGYDHAGHIRQAQHGEVYDAKDEGRFRIKEAPIILDYDSDLEETKKVPLKKKKANESAEENLSNKLESRITHSQPEIANISSEISKVPKNYKGEHKYSSRVKGSLKLGHGTEGGLQLTNAKDIPSTQATFPSYFDEVPPTSETIFSNYSNLYKPSAKKSSKYRKSDSNSTQIYPVSQLPQNPTSQVNELTDLKPFSSLIDSQGSPSAKSLKYSRIYSKKTKQLRLEPYKSEHLFPPPPPPLVISPPPPTDILQPPREPEKTEKQESINERIVLPTIGYINSLTTAHFGKENSKTPEDESKPQLTNALNLTEALTYLRMNKHQSHQEVTKSPTEIDIRTFEPMRLKKSRPKFIKTKRDVYLLGMQKDSTRRQIESYEGNDESDLPHVEKNEEIAEDERKRIEEENREKEKYEEDLRHEISNQEKQIMRETLRNIGVESDVSEVFPEFPDFETPPALPEEDERQDETTPISVNVRKYPFYLSRRLPENSPLRYATDPKQFPKKSGYKMEFYDSRERLIQCPDIHPDLDDLPDSNSTEYVENNAGEKQRLTRVGDKIACLRMKYFDPEPFDNPIFKEREIDYVGKPLKRSEKLQKKMIPKTASKEDQKLQQTVQQKPFVAKFNKFNATTQSLKPISTGQLEAKQQTKMQFSPTQLIKNESRIIPVTEVVDDLSPHELFQSPSESRPSIGWMTTYHSRPQKKSHPPKARILKPHNCLPYISKLEALDGAKNLTIECADAIIVQEIINNVPRLRVIPKQEEQKKITRKKWSEKIPPDQSDWIPIIGYAQPKRVNQFANPLSRRTDEVKLKNETSHNTSSTHYVIDELKEDEKVRKGEVVEDMDHYMKLMDEAAEMTTVKVEAKTENTTREKREAPNETNPKKSTNFAKRPESFDAADGSQTAKSEIHANNSIIPKSLERKRPLKRLSGIDFLTRYHKNKGKHSTQKTEDFWKITTAGPATGKNISKPEKTTKQEVEKNDRTTSKNKENKQDETTPPTIESDLKGSEFRKHRSDSSLERYNKSKGKESNESRKISPLNIIPEKITKRPEGKNPEFWKTSTQNPERTTTKPHNLIKIVTKVGRATSESSKKLRIVKKQFNHTSEDNRTAGTTTSKPELLQYKTISRSSAPAEDNRTARTTTTKPDLLQYKTISRSSAPAEDNRTARTTTTKPDLLQYKTISRSSGPAEDNSDYLSRSTENPEGPILYYVVNVRTGRGKWIKNYEEQLRREKLRKIQKEKENSAKRDKRRKTRKY